MKATIIYDSYFGNTEKIAQTIHQVIVKDFDTKLFNIQKSTPEIDKDTKLLIIGSPTRAFRPTENISKMIKSLGKESLKDVYIASFDTRANLEKVNNGFLNFMVKLFGYAAEPINKELVKKGGISIVNPEGFLVEESEGPLSSGENDRAKKWAEEIISKIQTS